MTTKKRRKKKKNHNKPIIITVIIGILIIICAVSYIYREPLLEKAKDYGPQSFQYPTEYEEYVIKFSNEYDVDATLVFSVIRTESNFDSTAVSSVGARGLMQLMEDAYEWVKYRLDDTRDLTFDDMFDPETNIQYGAYYLSYLMDKYDDSLELSAAAYHCGMGTVDGWLEDGTLDADNFNVDDIPDENDQTSHYVTKIMKAYENYVSILKEENSNGQESGEE